MRYILEEREFNDLQNKIKSLKDKNEALVHKQFELEHKLFQLHALIDCLNLYTRKDDNNEYEYFHQLQQ